MSAPTRAAHGTLAIDWRTVGPFVENSYLVVDRESRKAALVDPGDEPEVLAEMVRESGASLEAVWLTHAHLDHIGAVQAIRRIWDVPVLLHADDLPVYHRGAESAREYELPFEQPADPDGFIVGGSTLTLGASSFAVHHTPGHAPGHVVFVADDVMIGGDLLFEGSVGRTDMLYCDPAAMAVSLAHVLAFDDGMLVYPGHGPATSIGAERGSNPFLVGLPRAGAR